MANDFLANEIIKARDVGLACIDAMLRTGHLLTLWNHCKPEWREFGEGYNEEEFPVKLQLKTLDEFEVDAAQVFRDLERNGTQLDMVSDTVFTCLEIAHAAQGTWAEVNPDAVGLDDNGDTLEYRPDSEYITYLTQVQMATSSVHMQWYISEAKGHAPVWLQSLLYAAREQNPRDRGHGESLKNRMDSNEHLFNGFSKYKGYYLLKDLAKAVRQECAAALHYVIQNDVGFLCEDLNAELECGRKVIEGAQKAGKGRKGYRKGGRDKEEIVREYLKKKRSSPNLTPTRISDMVGRMYGLSGRTVRNYIREESEKDEVN